MLFSDITIIDKEFNILRGMYVGTKDERIDYIDNKMPDADYGQIYDGRGKLLMSGFFNSHAHTPMTLMRGYGENMSLQAWLTDKIFPFEDKLNGNDIYYATLLGISESLRYGIVSTSDMYYFCDSMAQAILESGVKNNLSRGLTCFTDDDLKNLESYKESKRLYEQYNNAGNGRLKVDMSIHAEYTSKPKIVKQLAEYTKELGTRMHVHVSETKFEHEACKERHNGKTPIAYFNELGLFDSKTTAAHCIWVEDEDIEILADKGVTVSTCPISNLKLASGVCNVPLLLEKNVNVTIGTDSVSSNNNLNYIEEMKFFSLIHKERFENPTLIIPEQALYAGTRAGALAQERKDSGRMEVGFRADLVVLDIEGPHMYPVHNLMNNLIYSSSGSDIVLTMVDGEVLFCDGDFLTIDIERVKYEVEKSKNRILNEMK